jgi:hypothetical protein
MGHGELPAAPSEADTGSSLAAGVFLAAFAGRIRLCQRGRAKPIKSLKHEAHEAHEEEQIQHDAAFFFVYFVSFVFQAPRF